MKKELKDKMIADIMDGFDFAKVHDIMQSLDWEWAIGHGESEVPSMWRIMEQAKHLLEEVAGREDGKCSYISTGGFMAMKHEDGSLTLHFVLESFDADIDFYEEEE
jgi:hypothetical protein